MHRWGWTCAILLTACPAGPPTREASLFFRLRPVEVGTDTIVWSEATLDVRAVRLRACPGDPITLDWAELSDTEATFPEVVHPASHTVGFPEPASLTVRRAGTMPVGPWCGFELVMGGNLVAKGELLSGATISFQAPVPDLELDVPEPFGLLVRKQVEVDGLVLPQLNLVPLGVELGQAGWLDAYTARLAEGEAVEVAPEGDEADALGAALVGGAVLIGDTNADAQVSDEERADALGPLVPLASP